MVFPGPADARGKRGWRGRAEGVPQTGNVHGPQQKKIGDTDKGFADADA